MPFPQAWPPRRSSSRRSIRFFAQGVTTGRFDDSAYIWIDQAGADPYVQTPVVDRGAGQTQADIEANMGGGVSSTGTLPQVPAEMIRLFNDGAADIQFSFDGSLVHGVVKTGESIVYRNRREAGIAMRSGTAAAGSITTVAVASLVDAETVTIGDGVATVTFEFDVAGDGVNPANVAVDVSALTTADDVRDALVSAINQSILEVTASSGGAATVSLVADNLGTPPNVAILETVFALGFIVSGMAGGADAPVNFRLEAW